MWSVKATLFRDNNNLDVKTFPPAHESRKIGIKSINKEITLV